MADPKIAEMSESEEMYLVSIASLLELGIQSPVPISQLAERLGIQPVSVNQMIRKLEESGMIVYTPYKGVQLTEEGDVFARQILRRRRLWEVFLVENLKLSPQEAGDLACRLEHAFSVEATEHLSNFLGHPTTTPSGESIPDSKSEFATEPEIDLLNLTVGSSGNVSSIALDRTAREFLNTEGIRLHKIISVVAVGSEGDILICTDQGNHVHLAKGLAKYIRITRIKTKER